LTTIAVRGFLKLGNLLGLYPEDASFNKTLNQQSLVSPGYPWLLREVCRARDRYHAYQKARHFAANSGLVILDRYPLSMVQIMDGPQVERFVNELMDGPLAEKSTSPKQSSKLTKFLVKIEDNYYDQIAPPEIMIVLLLDPEIAVERKTDEDSNSVRERSTEIWELDWTQSDAHIIEASKSKTEVLMEIKDHIWSQL
jgi:hypothetical protein